MVSEAFGVLLAVVVEGQLIGKYRKTGDCSDNGEVSDDQIDKEVTLAYYLKRVLWKCLPDYPQNSLGDTVEP